MILDQLTIFSFHFFTDHKIKNFSTSFNRSSHEKHEFIIDVAAFGSIQQCINSSFIASQATLPEFDLDFLDKVLDDTK